MIDPSANTYGLHKSLLFPIAATDRPALEEFVGQCQPIGKRNEEVVLLVTPRTAPGLELTSPLAARRLQRLRMLLYSPQVWVHPDYDSYRQAFENAPGVRTAGDRFLDHIMNREMARVLQYAWLRLCPVSREVNTNAGNSAGGEVRLSKDENDNFVRDLEALATEMKKEESNRGCRRSRIVYADPFDVTKMLNLSPGTVPSGLKGVRRAQKRFFAK